MTPFEDFFKGKKIQNYKIGKRLRKDLHPKEAGKRSL
jgi:hypothetical protein